MYGGVGLDLDSRAHYPNQPPHAHSLPPRVPDGDHSVRERRARGGGTAQGPLRVRRCRIVPLAMPMPVRPRACFSLSIQSHTPTHPNNHDTVTHSDVMVPQARPLSAGEVLGCTAPKLDADR